MLAALGLLLVGLVVYLLVSLVRYRSAVKRSRPARPDDAEGESRYLSASAEQAEDVFAVPVAGVPAEDAPGSLAERVYDFTIPPVHSQPTTPIEAELEPEPEPEPAPVPEPAPEPVPETEPAPVPEPEPAPEPALEPSPEPAPAEPVPEPEIATLPGYSLADELERLMSAATTVSAPLLTPAEHEAVVSLTQAPEPEPPFEPRPEPLFPAPSVGQALSSVARSPETAPSPVAAPVEAERAATPPVDEPGFERQAADVPDYTLVAPVELHFTAGQGRIGVKPGTRSYAEFQRLAGILLDDLRAAREW